MVNQVQAEKIEEIKLEPKYPMLSHPQELWLASLEYCESRGNKNAINKVDLDGTPSYYSFQFKPGTFKSYGEKYGVIGKGKTPDEIMELMKSYDLQKGIVTFMIHDSTVVWKKQFPDCVRKFGLPPRISL